MAKRKAATPPPAQLRAAQKLARSFHGPGPQHMVQVQAPAAPAVGMCLGRVVAIGYVTPEGVRYMHPFRGEAGPALVASADGASLHLVGGRYHVTGRGIIDSRK